MLATSKITWEVDLRSPSRQDASGRMSENMSWLEARSTTV